MGTIIPSIDVSPNAVEEREVTSGDEPRRLTSRRLLARAACAGDEKGDWRCYVWWRETLTVGRSPESQDSRVDRHVRTARMN